VHASRAALAAAAYVVAANACAASGDELGDGPAASAASTTTGVGASTSSSANSSGSGASGSSSSSASSGDAGGGGNGGQGGDGAGGSIGGAGGIGNQGGAGGGSGGTGTGGTGGALGGKVLLLAGGGANVLAGDFHPSTGWTTTPLSEATTVAPAVAVTSATTGVGLVRSNASSGELRATTWNNGTWSAFTAVGPAITTQSRPALAVSGVVARAIFHGNNFKHYFASYAGTWAPADEEVGAPQSFGPSAPSITTIGPDVIIAFAGNDHDVYDQVRTNGFWQAATKHNLGDVTSSTPAIVTMTSGSTLLIVFARTSDKKLLWTAKTGASWTAAQEIDMAFASDAPALLALPGGDALVAFRGLDGKLYTSRYDDAAMPAWSAPAALSSTVVIPSTPALATGVEGATAELAFVDGATGVAHHARLTGTTWSAPAAVGGTGLTHVALGSAP
jgi:hypothetical protein